MKTIEIGNETFTGEYARYGDGATITVSAQQMARLQELERARALEDL